MSWSAGAKVVYAVREGRKDERAFKRWGHAHFCLEAVKGRPRYVVSEERGNALQRRPS